jgi:GH15 family glucan-1,4-alpha-glucosidase
LPERLGGDRNYDYRFSWVRDASFSLDAFAALGFREQLHGSLSWLLGASEASHPRIDVFYAVDGSVPPGARELDLHGYRGSAPVTVGNDAAGQLQLGSYGDLLDTVWTYVDHGNALDRETATRMCETADFLCRIWRHGDSGIWELADEARHYTTSKIGCWVALDRALRMADCGEIDDAGVDRWRREAGAVREFVETRCWSSERRSYRFHAEADALDASVLLAARMGYADPAGDRLQGTIAAIRDELGAGGPLLYRYSGQQDEEGAFLACSFWLIEALALSGRVDAAAAEMDAMLARANDVGLFSEEIDPTTGELLGNFPQGLTHLALINAAACVAGTERRTR